MCHLILLAPVLALPILWLLQPSIAVPAYGTVLVITALIVWPAVVAMRRPSITGQEGMVGAQGEALTELSPHGLIRCQGECGPRPPMNLSRLGRGFGWLV